MKHYKIIVIFKDCEKLELEGTYTFMCEVFNRLNSELILRNKTENDVLKLSFKL